MFWTRFRVKTGCFKLKKEKMRSSNVQCKDIKKLFKVITLNE